jgi:hypothetical protein
VTPAGEPAVAFPPPVDPALVDAPATPPDGDEPEPEFSALMREALLQGVGGVRGTIDSSVPVVVFVIVNLATTLRPAVAAAAGAGVALMILRLIRRQSIQQAIGGLGGLAIACLFALRSGKATGFYLPGILYGCFLAGLGAVTIVSGWPLGGVALGFLDERWKQWRTTPRLRRIAGGLTGMWTCFYVIKAGIGASLYVSNHATGLAGVRLALGWPPFILLALATAAVLRNVFEPEDVPVVQEAVPAS